MSAPGLALAVPLAALAIPCTLGAAGALGPTRAAPLRAATRVTGLVLGLALAVAAASAVAPTRGDGLGVRVDLLTHVMLVLVCALAHVIARYSASYLAREPGAPRYARWLLLTQGAVTALVVADHLLVIALAWTATSLALHQLLTFYPDRIPARVAAHKKFLVSRAADVCMASALVLLALTLGTAQLDAIGEWTRTHGDLPAGAQLAAVLIVLAAALRSAQLPVHGWLIQVMEAPTPVSALLHAGVVNIGGFVLLRVAPLLAEAPVARGLLIAVGLATTVMAALVMMTRVSVKVALAWSTSAQMGFLLVECGLGAWRLALLHLVAHSLYKAHAFLRSGSAVSAWRARAGRRAILPPRAAAVLGVGLALGAAVAASVVASAGAPEGWLLGCALAPLAVGAAGHAGRARLGSVGMAVALAGLYLGVHALAARAPIAAPEVGDGAVAWALVCAAVGALLAVQLAVQLWPDGRVARALHPRLYVGFSLDERVTALAFRVWPPRMPAATDHAAPASTPGALGARSEVGA